MIPLQNLDEQHIGFLLPAGLPADFASHRWPVGGRLCFHGTPGSANGDSGRPSAWGTKGFYPRVPQFADAPSQLSAPEMFFVVKNGIRYSGMGAWDGMISDTEIWQVVTFLSNIKSLPEPVAAAWTKP
jgi:hypothetical protein